MKEIPLTRGMVALVDDDDHGHLSKWKWHTLRCGRNCYAIRSVFGGGKRGKVLMHREILPCKDEVDHINGDGLDNRRENLRPATHAQNCRNMKKYRHAQSRFKGVSWHKHNAMWRARIQGSFLGCFHDEEEAARAYDSAARHHFGEFARTNFTLDPERITA